ncbi:hypothetical protein HII31_00588 [Pseudocercospora fuligena]|uniref:BTB domain-containing protein n=1 Tax=Pseudocercospora fuligena TaxID=685502 RepID=A0A8H6RWJ8_9PEZI|nr:hypothetical protein HII31_00588 [Pseudocercospora fuligena]
MDSAPHFAKLFASPSIKIVVGVGQAAKDFHIPQNALLLHGSWFQSCLNNFSEAQSKEISLPEHTPAAFAIFVFWIFNGTLPGVTLTDAPDAASTTPAAPIVSTKSLLGDLIDAYLLAQYLMLDDFKDAIMDKMCPLVMSSKDGPISDVDAMRAWNNGEEELKRFVIDAVQLTLPLCKEEWRLRNAGKIVKYQDDLFEFEAYRARMFPTLSAIDDFRKASEGMKDLREKLKSKTRIELWVEKGKRFWLGLELFVSVEPKPSIDYGGGIFSLVSRPKPSSGIV